MASTCPYTLDLKNQQILKESQVISLVSTARSNIQTLQFFVFSLVPGYYHWSFDSYLHDTIQFILRYHISLYVNASPFLSHPHLPQTEYFHLDATVPIGDSFYSPSSSLVVLRFMVLMLMVLMLMRCYCLCKPLITLWIQYIVPFPTLWKKKEWRRRITFGVL